jgi:mitogen-activated protein kinase organizer 1
LFLTDPITSIVPTNDSQTLLITTLDSTIRLLDLATGKILNTFKSHTNTSYRTRGCFGFGEASVICGDENGVVWAWDLVDVGTVLKISKIEL